MKATKKTVSGALMFGLLVTGIVGCSQGADETPAPQPKISQEAKDRLQPTQTGGASSGGATSASGPEAPPPDSK
ncbi:MAG: hypothetical protein ACKVQS_11925 [Fimbriimonadaceae bacterium]